MAERRRKQKELEDQIAALERGEELVVTPEASPAPPQTEQSEALVSELNERLEREGAEPTFDLPSAPDLDKLSDGSSDQG